MSGKLSSVNQETVETREASLRSIERVRWRLTVVELQSSSNDRSARAATERSGLSQKHRKLGRVVEVGMGPFP